MSCFCKLLVEINQWSTKGVNMCICICLLLSLGQQEVNFLIITRGHMLLTNNNAVNSHLTSLTKCFWTLCSEEAKHVEVDFLWLVPTLCSSCLCFSTASSRLKPTHSASSSGISNCCSIKEKWRNFTFYSFLFFLAVAVTSQCFRSFNFLSGITLYLL